MSPLVEEIYLALDKGEDETLQQVSKISNVKIIESVWDMSLSKGLVLSVETNKALHALKSDHHQKGEWGIYLQADEVLHEDDYDLIKTDILKAEESGCDAMSFRYLHFWQTHHHLAIAKNWYPEEIRAVKLNSQVESYGDAQSFKNHTKVFQSEARIFHYGHVRDQSIYKNKMEDMSKLYDSDASKSKYYNAKDRDKDYTDCLLYFGPHPFVMKNRILRMGDTWELEAVESVTIIGNQTRYSEKVVSKINAKKVQWLNSISELKPDSNSIVVKIEPNLFEKLFQSDLFLDKMKSKIARRWSNDFILIMRLSDKKVGIKLP